MHEFKKLFLESGYDLPKELPEYLPALLELAATVEPAQSKKILSTAQPKIELFTTLIVGTAYRYWTGERGRSSKSGEFLAKDSLKYPICFFISAGQWHSAGTLSAF